MAGPGSQRRHQAVREGTERPLPGFVNRDNIMAVSYDVYIEGMLAFSACFPCCQLANGG